MELRETVPWGRSYDEYVGMFALGERELKLRILGCGDGPAAFNAEMTRRGQRVVSVDPLYQFSGDAIAARIDEVYARVVETTRRNADAFHWSRFHSPEELGRWRMEVMRVFLADFPAGRLEERYVEAALPSLPFDAGEFDLAHCSHLLFTYCKIFSENDHVAAIREMVRVAGEARIFPLLDMFDGGRSPHLDGVIRRLHEEGFTADMVPVEYEFQRGGNEMLRVCAKSA